MNKKLEIAGAGFIAAGLLAGGIGIGAAASDPTKSEEYAALSAEGESMQEEINGLDTDLAATKKRSDELLG